MTVSRPPITAILSIKITQPFSDRVGINAGKRAGKDHPHGGDLILQRGKIGHDDLRAVGEELHAADIIVHRVVTRPLKDGHRAAAHGLAARSGRFFQRRANKQGGKRFAVGGREPVNVRSAQVSFPDVCTDAWNTDRARGRAENIIGRFYPDGTVIDAWICSNDSTALGVEAALEAIYKGPYPIITGQDCDITNVKNIISGKQAMSVFKDTRTLADRAVTMADQILSGQNVEINDTETYTNGTKPLMTYLCSPVTVDVNNYKDILIDSGYYTPDMLI